MRKTYWLLVSAAGLWACGGSPPQSGTPASQPSAPQAAAAPASQPSGLDEGSAGQDSAGKVERARAAVAQREWELVQRAKKKRAKDAAKWLKDSASQDAAFRGILASVGLAEEEFGLPAPLRKGMEAVGSKSVDPSQDARIIAAALEDGAHDVVKTLCGKAPGPLFKDLGAKPKSGWTKLVVDQCKLGDLIDASSVPKDSLAFPLLSAVVQKIFEAEGGHSKAEFELAKLIAGARRSVR